MKNFKLNLFMVAALAIAGVTMSFKMAETATLWHYTGTANPGVFSDATNWNTGSAPANTCKTTGSKPCEITVNASDQTQLDSYLSGMSNTTVLNINPGSKRN